MSININICAHIFLSINAQTRVYPYKDAQGGSRRTRNTINSQQLYSGTE